MAVKFFLNTDGTYGSFDSPPTGGTSAGALVSGQPRLGWQAMRVFSPSGGLATGGSSIGSRQYDSNGAVTSSQGWPTWLTSFDIGISGANNTNAPAPACARFATPSEATTTNCKLGAAASSPTNCGAPQGQFRVSEADCMLTTGSATALGTGGMGDGVYIRAQFNRGTGGLGPNENVLMVVEYLASSLNPAPRNPTLCFGADQQFKPENCADFTWKVFLKHQLNENTSSITLQPFFMLIPPMINSVLGAAQNNTSTAGVNPTARQVILPLASDTNLSVVQLTRVQSYPINSTDLGTYCTPSGAVPAGGANTPLCDGVVFYSITFYRI